MQVTICGPNLPRRLTDRHGDSHAHAAGCADLRQYPDDDRSGNGVKGWTIEVSSVRDIIEAVWGDIMGDYSPPAPWTEYEHETWIAPCVQLPREVDVSSYYAWSKDGQLYGGLLEDYARSEDVAAHHGQTIGRPYRVIAHADDTVTLEEN